MNKRIERKKQKQLARQAKNKLTVPVSNSDHEELVDCLEGPGFEMLQKGRFILQRNTRSPDEHKDFVGQIRAERSELLASIESKSREIEALLHDFDSFDILASLALFESAIDPESYKEWEHEGLSAAVEYVALLALKSPYNSMGDRTVVDGQKVVQLSSLAHDVLMTLMWFCIADNSHEQGSSVAADLRFRSLTHSLIVRCHGYPHHLKELLENVLSQSASWIRKNLGFGVADLFAIEEASGRLFLQELNKKRDESHNFVDHIKSLLLAAPASLQSVPEYLATTVEELRNMSREDVSARLTQIGIAYTFLDIGRSCSFTASELTAASLVPIERVEAYLKLFSISFGEIPSTFYSPAPTHELMLRPYIHHNERYLRVSYDHLAAIQPRIEGLLNPARAGAINKDSRPWQQYVDHRAAFVEQKSFECFSRMMPNATVERNLKYTVTEGGVRKEVELDGMVHFDTNLLLVEVKAGTVDPATRRGAPKKMVTDAKDLIGAPDEQSRRAERYIRETESPTFRREDGSEFTIDKSKVFHTFRVCVTLDHLDEMMTTLFETAELGIFGSESLPWAVSIRDLLVIAGIIQFPSQFIHYLARRRRLNELGITHANDELDWFGHYLTEGLYFEELQKSEVSRLQLLSYTTQFDDWYFYQQGIRETPAPKPQMKLPTQLEQIIGELESSAGHGYTEVVLKLLDMSRDAQDKMMLAFDDIRRKVRKDGFKHNASMSLGDGKYGITVFAAKSARAEELFDLLPKFIEYKRATLNTESWVGLITIVGEKRLIQGWASTKPLDRTDKTAVAPE